MKKTGNSVLDWFNELHNKKRSKKNADKEF